ncbi:MAG: class I SAM-dependent methyltransferase [Candidatus Nitrosotenuis sp.]
MFRWHWSSNYTFPERYDETGIDDRIIEFAKKGNKTSLDILDVGCSNGIAAKCMKSRLKEKGLTVTITGIDRSRKMEKEARQNLDKFIPGNVLEIDAKPEFDMVICSKMVLFVGHKLRSEIISKCARFLRDNGGLVTDANRYEVTTAIQDLKIWINDYKKVFPLIRKGPIKFFKGIRGIQIERLKRKMFLIDGKERVEKYANEIIEGYNRLSLFQKFNVMTENLQHRASGFLNRKPVRKKKMWK